jgi:hypothetical protein
MKRGITYLTSSNYGYIKFCISAVKNFHNTFGKQNNLIVQCHDEKTFEEISELINKLGSDNIFTEKEYGGSSEFQNFYTGEYVQLMYKKFILTYNKLKENDAVYFFDADVHFFKDPTDYILGELEKNDLVFQQDAPLTDNHQIAETYVCAGNFAAKNSPDSIRFMETVISRFDGVKHDQDIMYGYLHSVCPDNDVRKYPNANLNVMDPHKFQNGFDAFRSGWYKNPEVVCVHANHMIGIDSKLNSFKIMGVDL